MCVVRLFEILCVVYELTQIINDQHYNNVFHRLHNIIQTVPGLIAG